MSFLHEMISEEKEYEKTELELSGLDPDELGFMDPDERREVLEDAGLDPDEYDF
jgi:2-hydroxychromene-2-carboxylate isomerase